MYPSIFIPTTPSRVRSPRKVPLDFCANSQAIKLIKEDIEAAGGQFTLKTKPEVDFVNCSDSSQAEVWFLLSLSCDVGDFGAAWKFRAYCKFPGV